MGAPVLAAVPLGVGKELIAAPAVATVFTQRAAPVAPLDIAASIALANGVTAGNGILANGPVTGTGLLGTLLGVGKLGLEIGNVFLKYACIYYPI